LEHMQVQPSIEDADVNPAVARRDRGLGGLAGAAHLVLRDPGRHEVGPVAGQLAKLLHEVLELVERWTLAGREVVERAAVAPRPNLAREQATLAGLLGRRPSLPPVTAEGLELVERGRAVDERTQLTD